MTSSKVTAFRREVWNYYKKSGRNTLPWRRTTDPYKILVSEIMLQQTQVPRVIEKYKSFIKKFPTARVLAKAPLSEVLKEWSGLGYNRRAKYLHDAAKVIVDTYDGDLKKALEHSLPGVGPYTRAAVRTFAFDEAHTMIETNIRSAITHYFFPPADAKQGPSLLHDDEILQLATEAAKCQDPRTWYWALMDYGSHLKRTGLRNNDRSAHYMKQSKFEGSLRQIRGMILRELHTGATSQIVLHKKVARTLLAERSKHREARGALAVTNGRLGEALAVLERDGLIKKEKGSASGRKWRIA